MLNWWRWLSAGPRDRRERIVWSLCITASLCLLFLWPLFSSNLRALLIVFVLWSVWIVPFVRWQHRRVPFSTTPHKFKSECVRSTLETAQIRAAAAGIGDVEPFVWKVRTLGNQVTVSYLYPKHWSMSGSAMYRQDVGEISHQIALST